MPFVYSSFTGSSSSGSKFSIECYNFPAIAQPDFSYKVCSYKELYLPNVSFLTWVFIWWGILVVNGLTHFTPMFCFYTRWRHQRESGFLTFQELWKWNIGVNRLRNQKTPWTVFEEQNFDFRLIFVLDFMSEDVN